MWLFALCATPQSPGARPTPDYTRQQKKTAVFSFLVSFLLVCVQFFFNTTKHQRCAHARPVAVVTACFFAPAVRGLLQGLLPPGEPEDPPALAHRGEALRVRARGLQQGLLQRLGPGQAPEPHTLQRGTHAAPAH